MTEIMGLTVARALLVLIGFFFNCYFWFIKNLVIAASRLNYNIVLRMIKGIKILILKNRIKSIIY